MNSERYIERLHQIKEKYGRTNHKNPEETLRQRSYKRETSPLHSQVHNYKHATCQQIPVKPLRKEGRLENQQQYKREKQNFPTTPLSLLKNTSPIGRGFPEHQSKRLQDIIIHRNEFPQSQRPSISENYLMQSISPRRNNQNNEYSSPIRKLQSEMDSQATPRHTPKHYVNITERPPPVTPPKNNISINAYTPHNHATSPLSKPNQIPPWRQNVGTSRIPERPPGIPKANETVKAIPRKEQQFRHQGQMSNPNGQKESKPAFSLNNIKNIQERIQMALKTNKK